MRLARRWVRTRRTQSNKMQILVKYTYIPESSQTDETYLPLLSPYTIFKRNRSLAKKINFLVQHRSPPVKEYIQSTALDNYLVLTTAVEQSTYATKLIHMATLHHQIAYRLQDHALDLPVPGHTGDTIFITTEREDEIPTIIQIPKQLPREKLKEVMQVE
ncbi:hypothetical protein Ddye_027340 [Dipteronia dyeriana]|uniref:Uncharacterized protein n=1 Tax=Dipteronia dyeriana TaxID=168575 RepID=A0AAD9TNX0_9ROSI|nr:hypothetical protein Ddye_027340 [Dipteronia dyeriana]